MSTFSIIVGIVAAAIVFYIRSSMTLAQKQKNAATRLRGYLVYWQGWIIDNDLFNLFYHGVKWNKEIREILEKGGQTEDLVELRHEKIKLLGEVQDRIESQDFDVELDEINRVFGKLNAETIASLLDCTKTDRQNLIEGKTFISDDDAATLGVAIMHQFIELKMHLIALMDILALELLPAASNRAEFDIKNYSKEFAQAVWKGIVVFKNIDSLTHSAVRITSQSVVRLTIRNMFREF